MGNFREISNLSVNTLNGFLLPVTDVSSFKWVSLHTGVSAFSGTVSFFGGNDPANVTVPVELFQSSNLSNATTSIASNTNGIWHGPVVYRFLAMQCTGYSSGTQTAIIELYENPAWWFQSVVQVAGSSNNIGNVGALGLPIGATQVNNSATGTNATATATLTGAANKFTYLTGFEVDSSGVVAAVTTITISGIVGGPLTYEVPTSFTNKVVEFNMPLQSTTVSTNITVAIGALGTGIIGSVNAHGYLL